MKNLSLAARYRPQTFAEVVGQGMVTTVLSRASAEDRPACAYLLSGTRGVGKTTIARIFAKALNCERAPCAEPCNECAQCRKVTQGSHVDVVEIDGASNNGVDDVRALRETVGYAPMEGRYKIFIIDEAHMLSKAAFNALLKTLEEPPAHVIFIMATTEVHKFPVTILSRCQHFAYRHLREDEIAAHLVDVLRKENVPFDEAAVRLVAKRAQGSVRDSMSLLDQTLALGDSRLDTEVVRQVLGLAGQEIFDGIFRAMRERDCVAVAKLVQAVSRQGVDIGFFVGELAGFLRSLFLARQGGEGIYPVLGLPEDEEKLVRGTCSLFSAAHLHAAWQMVLDSQRSVVQSGEPAAALELLLLNLTLLPRLLPLERADAALASFAQPVARPDPAGAGENPPESSERPAAAQSTASNAATRPETRPARPVENPVPLRQNPGGERPPFGGTGVEAGRPDCADRSGKSFATGGPGQPEAPVAVKIAETKPAAVPGVSADASVRPGAEHPSAPPSEGSATPWLGLCDFLEGHGDRYPLPMVVRVLRAVRAECSDGRITLWPTSGMLAGQIESIRDSLHKALAECTPAGAVVPEITVVGPEPVKTEAELIEEFKRRPEMQPCLAILGGVIDHCVKIAEH